MAGTLALASAEPTQTLETTLDKKPRNWIVPLPTLPAHTTAHASPPTHSVGAGRRGQLGPCLRRNTSAHNGAHVLNDRFDAERREHLWPLPLPKALARQTGRAPSITDSVQKLWRAPWPLPLPNLPRLSKPLLTKNHEIGSCLCRRCQLTKRRTLPHPPLRHGTTRATWPVCLPNRNTIK